MNAREFYNTVRDMREQQRRAERSKGRDRTAVISAHELERIIDMEIARVTLIEKERRSPRLEL